jgi:hypothetical protein
MSIFKDREAKDILKTEMRFHLIFEPQGLITKVALVLNKHTIAG